MSKPTILEMNRAIGEFDGWIYSESGKTAKKGKNGPSCSANDIRYHDSWKRLKAVIDKIFMYALVYPEQVRPIIEMRVVVNIRVAHERVYEFALWYLNEKGNNNLTPGQISERKEAIDWYRNPDRKIDK